MSTLSSLTLSRKTCPLGLLTVLGTSASSRSSGLVYNEEVSGPILPEGERLLDGVDWILLSANTGNVKRCVELARTLKLGRTGKVILGGPEPSMTGPRFLRDNPSIDAVMIGPGEHCIPLLEGEGRRAKIPGLVWRDEAIDCSPVDFAPPFRELDFRGAEIDYRILHDLAKHEGLSYFWGNDCSQATNRCFFCGRIRMGIGFRPASAVWDELAYAYDQGIRFFYNTTDSVSGHPCEFVRFCKAKPSRMTEDRHRVFVNSRDVTQGLVDALLSINGTAVMGIESFGRFLQVGKRHTRPEDNWNSIEFLHRAGVPMVLSFVFGLPGETHESISANEGGILAIVNEFGRLIEAIHLSPLLITMGSPAFRKLMALPDVRAKYEACPVPWDAVEMSKDYFTQFCNVSREYCLERIFAISDAVRSAAPHISIGAKGILADEERTYSTGRGSRARMGFDSWCNLDEAAASTARDNQGCFLLDDVVRGHAARR